MSTFKPNGRRFRILQRDEFQCRYCGRRARDGVRLEVDHIVPRARGGSDNDDNLVTACHECNSGKSDLECMEMYHQRMEREFMELSAHFLPKGGPD